MSGNITEVKKAKAKKPSLVGTFQEYYYDNSYWNEKNDRYERSRINGSVIFVQKETIRSVSGLVIPSKEYFGDAAKTRMMKNGVPVRVYLNGLLGAISKRQITKQIPIQDLKIECLLQMYILFSGRASTFKLVATMKKYLKSIEPKKRKKVTKKTLDKSK